MKFTTTERAILVCQGCQGATVVAPDNVYDTDKMTCNCHLSEVDVAENVTAPTQDAVTDADDAELVSVSDLSYADLKAVAFESGFTPAKGNPKRIDMESFLLSINESDHE